MYKLFVNSIELVVDLKKEEIEKNLKAADNLDSFDIEDLDDVDERKSVVLMFSEPVDMKYVAQSVKDIIGEETHKIIEE